MSAWTWESAKRRRLVANTAKLVRQALLKFAALVACLTLATEIGPGYGTESGWGVARPIESDNRGSAFQPEVALDASGNAIAVWRQYDGSRFRIWSNRYVLGSGWGTPSLVDISSLVDSGDPHVAVDSFRNAVVVWRQGPDIWASRYVVGVGWGEPVGLDAVPGTAGRPRVAVDPAGNAMAVWSQPHNASTRPSIWASRFAAGVGWDSPSLLESSSEWAYIPVVGVDSSGNAVVVWPQDEGAVRSIWANRYLVSSGWDSAVKVETGTGDAYYPDIVVNPSGTATAVWQQENGTLSRIFANSYISGIGWGNAELIDTVGSVSPSYGRPRVAADSSGNAFAVWDQYDGNVVAVWANRYVAGSGWGNPVVLDDQGVSPSVAVSPSGDAIARWLSSDGVRFHAWASPYVAGYGWGAASLIETDNSGSAREGDIAVDPFGNAIVVWEQFDPSYGNWNIWANTYTAPDISPPSLSLTAPLGGESTSTPSVTVSGTTEPGAHLVVNGVVVDVKGDGSFEFRLPLSQGTNIINVTAVDASGNKATLTRTVFYSDPIPGSQTSQLALGLTAAALAVALAGVIFLYRRLSRKSGSAQTSSPT